MRRTGRTLILGVTLCLLFGMFVTHHMAENQSNQIAQDRPPIPAPSI